LDALVLEPDLGVAFLRLVLGLTSSTSAAGAAAASFAASSLSAAALSAAAFSASLAALSSALAFLASVALASLAALLPPKAMSEICSVVSCERKPFLTRVRALGLYLKTTIFSPSQHQSGHRNPGSRP
jgi:hypothetical protein